MGIKMVVYFRIFKKNRFDKKNINNEQHSAKNESVWNTICVNIMRRQRSVNLHRICSKLLHINQL